MTAEEVWQKACAAYEDAAEEHPEMPLRDMVIAGDNAAVSVIRTAMEAYAAEKVAEALTKAQLEEVLSLSGEWTIRKWSGQQPPWSVWLPPSITEQATPTHYLAQRIRLTPLGLALRNHLKGQNDGTKS